MATRLADCVSCNRRIRGGTCPQPAFAVKLIGKIRQFGKRRNNKPQKGTRTLVQHIVYPDGKTETVSREVAL